MNGQPQARWDLGAAIQQHTIAQGLNEEYSSELVEFQKYLLEIEEIPEGIKNQLGGIVNRVHMLTKLTDSDIQTMLIRVDIILTQFKQSLFEWEFTPELQMQLSQLELIAYSLLHRSKDGFEREIEQTSIRQISYSQGDMFQAQPSTGLKGRIGRFFGGRQ